MPWFLVLLGRVEFISAIALIVDPHDRQRKGFKLNAVVVHPTFHKQ